MLEIEIAFIYFDESIKERTELLEKEIRTFKNNYLVYYIFCNNYCIFSNIEITKNEAKILVAFIEDDKGLDLLYGEGIKTEYATYRIYSDLNEENLNQEAIKESNSIFEEKLDKYLNNVKEAIDIKELQEKEKKLENINDKISEKDCTIEESKLLLEDYKKSIISEGVTRGLDCNSALKDSGIFYMGPIKETWSISKIGYICTKLSRGFLPEDTALVCSNKGKVLIRDENAVGKMVSEDNAMQGIKKGDIAIHGMDTWHGAIALSEYDGKITRVVHVCDSNEDKRFVVYYMQYLAFQGVYKLISNGVRGNTSDFRSWDKVKDIYIPLPESREEQKKICDHLDLVCKEIETAIDNKREQLDMLEQYKKATIYEYVTGKKEVPES